MNSAMLDTYAVVWHLFGSSLVSSTAAAFIESDVKRGEPLYVSAVSVLEVIYLVQKGRLPDATLKSLVTALTDESSDLVCVPWTCPSP